MSDRRMLLTRQKQASPRDGRNGLGEYAQCWHGGTRPKERRRTSDADADQSGSPQWSARRWRVRWSPCSHPIPSSARPARESLPNNATRSGGSSAQLIPGACGSSLPSLLFLQTTRICSSHACSLQAMCRRWVLIALGALAVATGTGTGIGVKRAVTASPAVLSLVPGWHTYCPVLAPTMWRSGGRCVLHLPSGNLAGFCKIPRLCGLYRRASASCCWHRTSRFPHFSRVQALMQVCVRPRRVTLLRAISARSVRSISRARACCTAVSYCASESAARGDPACPSQEYPGENPTLLLAKRP